MAPPAADVDLLKNNPLVAVPVTKGTTTSSYVKEPLKSSGSLDQYKRFDVTNVIGTEIPDAQLSDFLGDDSKIRDLAILGLLNSIPS